MHDWQEKTLEEISESIDYGLTASAETAATNCRFLRITDIVNQLNWSNVPYVTVSITDEKKYKLNHGDIVIARTGATTGASFYIKNPPNAVFASYLVRYKIKPEHSSRYVSYFLQSHSWWSYIKGVLGDKSAQPNASASTMAQVRLPIPPLQEQKAIAAVLGALDDKIELNRRMNVTLEAMARALFKSWFVDFDPVRAKIAGKQPFGMDTATTALFPSRLTSSPLGDIPEGWEVGRLSDILELLYGKALTKEDRQSGPYPVYGSGGVTGYNSSALVKGPGIIVGRKGTVGSLYWEDRNFFPIDTVFYVVPKQYFSLAYIFSQLECLGLENMNTDAAVPGLNRENAYRLDIVKPSQSILTAYTKPSQSILTAYTSTASEIRGKIRANNSEIEKLEKTRDYLLPKLISGDIRIPDAEKFVEAA